MNLSIDARENIETIIQILQQYPDIDYEINQLEYGDFIINNHIIFERKTLSDLIISIKDGRLFRQCYSVSSLAQPYILILEGQKKSISNTKMSRNTIQGALVHLSVGMGIPILRSKHLRETISLVVTAGMQYEKTQTIQKRRVYHKKQKARKAHYNRLKVQLLQSLPGIGSVKAGDILEEFGTIKQFINSTENELLHIKGIGKKTVKQIMKVLN